MFVDKHSNICIDRKQAQQLAVSCIDEISNYVDEHSAEFNEFLKLEEKNNKEKKGRHSNDKEANETTL